MTESGNKTQDILNSYVDGVLTERERIIKLLEEMPMMIYYAVANNGRILDKPCSPVVIEREAAIALIKGENKTNPWTSRPLTEEDAEHYGLEGEK